MRGVHLKANRLVAPNSLSPGHLTFSWIQDGEGWQMAFQIRIFDQENTVYESGKIESKDTYFTPDFVTTGAGKWRWSLILFGEDGSAGEEVCSSFGTAISREEWKAKWIDPEPWRVDLVRQRTNLKTHLKKLLFHKEREDIRYPSSYLLRRFCLTSEHLIKQNRLYVTAHGIYAVWLNGQRLKDWVLAPGCTQYPQILNVQAYDVSEYLRTGDNEIVVCLCDGWYRGSMNNERHLDTFGTDVALLLELRSGKETVLVSDERWEATQEGMLGQNDLQLGEHYDANRTLENADWHRVKVRDFSKANLTGSDCQPVREQEHFEAKLIRTPNGDRVLDFGQNFAGYVHMAFDAKGGETICLTHGETLDKDGNFTQKNIIEITKPDAYQQVFYTCSAGHNEYEPISCFFGFRYVKVETDMDIREEWFTGIAVYSDMKETAGFSCGNDKVNRLFSNSLWSMKSNFISIMMDCPTRERSGYTGDAQVFCPTGLYLMDCYPVYLSWMKSLEQLFTPDGQLKMFAPENKPISFMDSGHGWCDAIVIIPYLLWRRSGDIRILEEHYSFSKKWVDFALHRAAQKTGRKGKKKLSKELQPYFADQGFGFGEWLEVENGTTSAAAIDGLKHILFGEPEVGTAYLSYSGRLLSEMAEALGKTDEAAYYRKAAEMARQAYRAVYTDKGEIKEKKRQCLYVRPMALGLLDEAEKREAAKRLSELVRGNNNHLNTGFLSTAYLCRMLSDYGEVETAYNLLLQEESPSWLYEVNKGATTIWESWLGIDEKGDIRSSFNHYSLGAVTGWLIDSVCGIRVDNRKIKIAPKPDQRLGYAKGCYESPLGYVESSWKYENGKLSVSVVVPFGRKTEVLLPNGEMHICEGGSHEWSLGG